MSKRRTGADTLSNLPDCLIHRILSFVSIKQAVQTSVLSPRWRYIWTSMSCLNFLSEEFRTLSEFSEFARHVLSRRDDKVEVFYVKLTFCAKVVSHEIVKNILKYAFSHNLQQLNITSLNEETFKLHPSLLSSQSLTHLTLDGYTYQLTPPAPTWDLPALETLNLYHFTICYVDQSAGLFSSCASLRNLTLKNCRLDTCQRGCTFSIYHHGLSSLTLEDARYLPVNVEAPLLKSLTIKNWLDIRLVSTPNLSFLRYIDYEEEEGPRDDPGGDYDDDYYHCVYPLQICNQLPHLEKLHICIDRPIKKEGDIRQLISLFEQLSPVRFLTLNWELVKILSSFVESVSDQACPFFNLVALTVYPLHRKAEVNLSTEVKKYFLNGSPGATLSIDPSPGATLSIDPHEETLEQNLIQEMKALLEEGNKELNADNMKEEKVLKYNTTDILERYDQYKLYQRELSEDFTEFKEKWTSIRDRTFSVVLKMYALTKVSTSNQAKLKERFFKLYKDANSMLDDMRDRLKIKRETSYAVTLPSTGLLA